MNRFGAIFYSTINTPIGKILLASTNKGICWVSYDTGPDVVTDLKQWGKRWLSSDRLIEEQTAVLQAAAQQLQEYFQGMRKDFSIPFELYGTEFQRKVWQALLQIPYGEVHSYKEVAKAIGSPKAVRAVGGANNRNPLSIFIPCHRVVGADGSLVGYGGGLPIKEYLLKLEASALKKENNNSR